MRLIWARASYFFLYLLIGFVVIKHPSAEAAVDGLCLGLAKAMTWLLSSVDSGVARHGATVIRNTWGYALEVTTDCSALNYSVALTAAIFAATPVTFTQRLLTALAGLFFIQLINLLRLICLLYAKVLFPLPVFYTVHEQVWPLLLAFSTVGFFIMWAQHHRCLLPVRHRKQSSDATPEVVYHSEGGGL
jgi:exosortase/archaeosortase family protein